MMLNPKRLRLCFAMAVIGVVLVLAEQTARAGVFGELQDLEAQRQAARVVDMIMDGNIEDAIEMARDIERQAPRSPLGYLLEADAIWWRIYYETSDLVDPDVFDVVHSETTPYDSHFEDLVSTAIARSEENIRAGRDPARNDLYQGIAYALRARLSALRGKDLPAARSGKKMRALLLKALKLDPDLTDAYLGVGIYNYFVDTLPAIVKLLRFFIALPGGDRELGLQQLQEAAAHGELTRGEAEFYLAKNYSRRNEAQFGKSLDIFAAMSQRFPDNPLWPLLVGSLKLRLGQIEEGEAIYRKVFNETSGKRSVVQRMLHKTAWEALERRHPGQLPNPEQVAEKRFAIAVIPIRQPACPAGWR